MYFPYGGAIDGGHNVMGATRAGGDLVLRRGLHRDRLRRVPDDHEPRRGRRRATHHLLRRGRSPRRSRGRSPLAANSRTTVAVHDAAIGRQPRRPRAAARPTRPRSRRPCRSSSSGRCTSPTAAAINGGHNVMGATAPRASWLLRRGLHRDRLRRVPDHPEPRRRRARRRSPTTSRGRPRRPPGSCRWRPTAARRSSSTTRRRPATPAGSAGGLAHSTKVETTVPVVVERPMYFAYSGATASPAATTSWGASLPGVGLVLRRGLHRGRLRRVPDDHEPRRRGQRHDHLLCRRSGQSRPRASCRWRPTAARPWSSTRLQGAGNPGGLGRGRPTRSRSTAPCRSSSSARCTSPIAAASTAATTSWATPPPSSAPTPTTARCWPMRRPATGGWARRAARWRPICAARPPAPTPTG